MTRRFSFYLDLVRFLTAFLVLLSHLAYRRFTDGNYQFVRDWNIGSDAVVIFFVLSGLVIAYTADVKDRTLGAFAFNRLTRLYSVAIPAVVLTVVLDTVGRQLHPSAYGGFWYQHNTVFDLLFKGLTFSTEWGVKPFRLGSNGPYWSLSYEVAYYALFAAAVYLRGWQRAVAFVVMVPVFGLKPLLMLPIWLFGVMIYRNLRDGVEMSRVRAWALVVLPPAIYVACMAAALPKHLMARTDALLGERFVNYFLNFSDEFVWNTLIGILAAAHFLGMAVVLRRHGESVSDRVEKVVRWLAGASFSIYLVHYPVMQFAEAVLTDDMPRNLRHFLLLLITVGVCFLVAEIFERRLPAFRAMLRQIGPRRRPAEIT